jgi:hypothetical protein
MELLKFLLTVEGRAIVDAYSDGNNRRLDKSVVPHSLCPVDESLYIQQKSLVVLHSWRGSSLWFNSPVPAKDSGNCCNSDPTYNKRCLAKKTIHDFQVAIIGFRNCTGADWRVMFLGICEKIQVFLQLSALEPTLSSFHNFGEKNLALCTD